MRRPKYYIEDLRGKRFGRLILIKHYRMKIPRAIHMWICRCDCGNIVHRQQGYLTYEERDFSCGCSTPVPKGNQSRTWRGCGNIGHQYYSAIQFRCKKSGHELQLTIQDLWSLFQQQSGLCALTGLPLNFSTQRSRERGIEQTASLDRIDSTKGYVPGNVWWIHKDVNRMKNAYPLERFIEVCRLVVAKADVATAA